MATTKKVIQVDGGNSTPTQPSRTFVPTPEAKGRATRLRLIAGLLWFVAICAQIGAIFLLLKQVPNMMIWMIVLIVVDLASVIIGSLLWKKSNRLDPASEKDKFKFFLQNQLGLFAAIVAFLPLIIFIFTSKNLDGKQKGILGGIAVLALAIAGITSYDFNPPSVEQYTEQTNRVEWLNDGQDHVFWTKSGTKYHLYEDCPHINSKRTDEIYSGTVAQARELKNITELCKTCENRAIKERGLKEADYSAGVSQTTSEANE
ncbi:MAG: hypothetical protein LBN18_04205 [Dysgonamonadaceae bacterium]|jgi:hypothetical protein|nr:hypothetical protein [Dysgonamonadaceae bacterium]